ncbi:RagB/SusD family nutrient uptake outer membrane protein [Anaerophaga thermohalophila]|uniref:RagB/SusD family nutrient uptake outer membrane protein n=1 Tax=Anaerophaga thermohalophila TaxID=177400 RepID=UPI000237CBEB|nr:RagB/SusD family nutrient uptake outer membrane protein [Anaerophaga thermohalophila]
MRNIVTYFLITVFGIFIFTGCEDDLLETETKSSYTTDVVFSNPAFTLNALYGIYSLMTLDEMYSQKIPFYASLNSDIEVVAFGTGDYADNGRRGIGNYLATPGNNEIARPWNALYRAIERANILIEEVPKSPVMEGDNEEAKRKMWTYYGEALTLRALFYFDLVRIWGDVPFKVEPTQPDGSNFFLGKTDRDEILESIIEDLQEAEQYVPWIDQSDAGTPERISKGFVKGLMARVALYRGGYSVRAESNTMERGSNWEHYYQIARDQCKEIMDEGVHSLNPSFKDVFIRQNQLEPDRQYYESLFEVGHGMTRSGEAGYYSGVRYETSSKYGRRNQGGELTLPHYLYSFEPEDARRYVSVAFYSYNEQPQMEIYTDPSQFRFAKWNIKWMTDAYIAANRNAGNKLLTGINWCLMRYSDVLLMFAEAENALNGPTAEAKEALKEVRRRAFPTEVHAEKVDAYVDGLSSPEDFFEAIVDERALEFGGESIRKFDLVRWNMLYEKITEARELNRKIVYGEAPYDYVPQYLYYQYREDDPEDLNFETLNLDEELGDINMPDFDRVEWMSGRSEEEKQEFIDWLNLMSSGLDQYPNRHLLPIAQPVIDDANGAFTNEYGY